MVEEIEAEGPEVEERSNQTPILGSISLYSSRYTHRITNLAPDEYGAEAVEQLVGRHHVALHQQTRAQSSRHPPSRAHGHLVEPLLERELTNHAAAGERVRHIEAGCRRCEGRAERCRWCEGRSEWVGEGERRVPALCSERRVKGQLAEGKKVDKVGTPAVRRSAPDDDYVASRGG